MTDSGYPVVLFALVLFAWVFYLFGQSLKRTPTPRLREVFLVAAMKNYAMTFAVICANVVFDIPLSLAANLVLVILGVIIAQDEKRRKELLLEQELAEVEGGAVDEFETKKAKTPTPFEFWMTLLFCVLLCLYFSWLLVERFFPVLLDFEEQLVGNLLLGIVLLCHLVYFTRCATSSSLTESKDETNRWHDEQCGEASPSESAETLRDRLLAYRDNKDKNFRGILVALCMVGLFFHVAFSPFVYDVFDRHSYRNKVEETDFDATQSTVAALPGGAGIVDVTVSARNFHRLENPCTAACFPLGYAVDDENRLLWSEAVFEIMQTRLRCRLDLPKQPILLEGVHLGSEQMMFALIRWQNDGVSPYEILQQSISTPLPNEAETFETLKNRLLKKLDEEARSPEHVAIKFGPAAASVFCRFDSKRIAVFDDLHRITHEAVTEYLAGRIRSQRSFIGEIVTGPNPGQPMQALLRHFEAAENEGRLPLPPTLKSGEHRGQWNLEPRAVVDFRPLPDPAREPYAHAAMIFAAKALVQQAKYDGLLAISSGIHSTADGPMLRMVTVWGPESELGENLHVIDEIFRHQAERLDWNALKIERGGQAQIFAPVWIGPHHTRSGAYALLWGGTRFRYAPWLDDESQYRALTRSSLWLSRRAVKNAVLEMTDSKNRTRIIFEPK